MRNGNMKLIFRPNNPVDLLLELPYNLKEIRKKKKA
jgi:hypothetical protein